MNQQEPRYCHKHEINVNPFFSTKQNRWFCMHYVKDENGKSKTCFVNTEEEDIGYQEKQQDYAMDGKCFNDEPEREK